jgi:putative SOS response-associated peptidase YedK
MSKREAWFALTDENQQGMFAGIWRSWQGVRGPKSRPVEGEHIVFAFLTCQPNEIVAPIHPKAMPVILANADQQEAWLHAPASAVPALAGPLALDQLVLLDAARARS